MQEHGFWCSTPRTIGYTPDFDIPISPISSWISTVTPSAADGKGQRITLPPPSAADGKGQRITLPPPSAADGKGQRITLPPPSAADGKRQRITLPPPSAADGKRQRITLPPPSAADGKGQRITLPPPSAADGKRQRTFTSRANGSSKRQKRTLPLPPSISVNGRKDLLRKVIESSRTNDASTTKQCIRFKLKEKIIDLDKVKVSINLTDDSPWLPNLNLRTADRDILLSKGEWLNDLLIDAAQSVLKTENNDLSGFQSTVLGQNLSFNPEQREFVQILHNGRGHWLTVSTVGAPSSSVFVYDSLYSSASPSQMMQIASLLYSKEKKISLLFKDVQMQDGSSDCGVFAIAFATAITFGLDPGAFLFDQSKMRQHLLQCLQKSKMSMFPVNRYRRVGGRIKYEDTISLFCICRLPKFSNSNWVQCSKCKEWFHDGICVFVPEELKSSPRVVWFCEKCKIN